jgi:ribosome-associated protein
MRLFQKCLSLGGVGLDQMTMLEPVTRPDEPDAAGSSAGWDADKVLRAAAMALSEKKGLNLCALDLSGITTVARYFLIATGTSSTHIKALADAVEDSLGKAGVHPFRRSGYGSARWILLDFSDVVVHVFHGQDREFYGLERLWQDAVQVSPATLLHTGAEGIR